MERFEVVAKQFEFVGELIDENYVGAANLEPVHRDSAKLEGVAYVAEGARLCGVGLALAEEAGEDADLLDGCRGTGGDEEEGNQQRPNERQSSHRRRVSLLNHCHFRNQSVASIPINSMAMP